jgi:hypothetical protein
MNTAHPRFPHRLRIFGTLLVVMGLTMHMRDSRILLMAGVLITVALLVRLFLELRITGEETEEALESKYKVFRTINEFSLAVVALSLFGFIRQQ